MSGLHAGQITGTNFAYQDYSFEKFLNDMVLLERTRIELWAVAPHLYIPEAGEAEVRALRRAFAERDLALYCLTPEQIMYPVNLASDTAWIRESSLAMFRRAAEICAELEGELLFLTPGRVPEDASVEDGWARSVDGVRGVAEYAAGLGVRCVIESLQRRESNLVHDLASLERLFTEVAHPNLSIALDTVAMATGGAGVEDYYAAFGDRIAHVHLVDGSPSGHRAWGDGTLPLADYLRVLDEHAYAGMMSFEIFGADYSRDPFAVHQRTLRSVTEAIAALPPRAA